MSLSMLNRSIASMAGRAPGGSYDVQEYFWGAELSKDKPSFKWNPEVRLWLSVSSVVVISAAITRLWLLVSSH